MPPRQSEGRESKGHVNWEWKGERPALTPAWQGGRMEMGEGDGGRRPAGRPASQPGPPGLWTSWVKQQEQGRPQEAHRGRGRRARPQRLTYLTHDVLIV